MVEFKKFVRGGKTAIIISPGWGVGWFTLNKDEPGLLFDEELVAPVLSQDWVTVRQVLKQKYPDVYTGNVETLIVQWWPTGRKFVVSEYDGWERIRDPEAGIIA